jgi:tetratricopeptide (TPR) repeat protein
MPSQAQMQEGIGPALKDSNEMINAFFSTPLFMTEAPKNLDDPSLLAIQSLLYDGDPQEVADNFKSQGNECMKNGQFREALNYYNQGIQAVQDPIVKSTLLSNAAAAHLKLENYKMALNATAESIRLNHLNLKSFYRSIRALVALDKIDDALAVCRMALEIEENNKDFKKEMMVLQELKRIKVQKIKDVEAREKDKMERESELIKAVNSRNINLFSRNKSHGSSILSFFHSDHHVTLQEDGSLSWPVLFLYPEYQESDFITSFDENTTFMDHLQIMFQEQSPWDVKNEYVLENLQVYFETRGTDKTPARLLKASRNMKLKTVISNCNYTVIDGIPTFFILSKTSQFSQKFSSSYK